MGILSKLSASSSVFKPITKSPEIIIKQLPVTLFKFGLLILFYTIWVSSTILGSNSYPDALAVGVISGVVTSILYNTIGVPMFALVIGVTNALDIIAQTTTKIFVTPLVVILPKFMSGLIYTVVRPLSAYVAYLGFFVPYLILVLVTICLGGFVIGYGFVHGTGNPITIETLLTNEVFLGSVITVTIIDLPTLLKSIRN